VVVIVVSFHTHRLDHLAKDRLKTTWERQEGHMRFEKKTDFLLSYTGSFKMGKKVAC
jgi:hypothetical protein